MTQAVNDDVAIARYLDAYLSPLLPVLAEQDVTDVYINKPGEIWIERNGALPIKQDMAELSEERLWRLARQIASLAHQGISREHPLLASILPDGARIQIIAPPATRGPMAIAIRKHMVSDLTLDDLTKAGVFGGLQRPAEQTLDDQLEHIDQAAPETVAAIIAAAVKAKKNIVISGGTSSGKTTFLNALLREIEPHERLIFIEDTPELKIRHNNAIGLVAVKGELGEARVDADSLLQASLRMRPDRIIMGELRGSEAYTFLRAVNTGHPGSLTTIHADSPEGAVEQLALMILQSGVHLRRDDIVHYVLNVIDIFIQLDRRDGQREVSHVATSRSLPAKPV